MNEEAKNLLAQARIQSDFGRKAEATVLLQQALALNPDDTTLLCYLATAYHQQKQWDKMLACAEQAVCASPNNDWPHRVHSIALRYLKRREEGLAAAREAVRCCPESPITLDCLVHALLHCGKRDEAKETALHMVQVVPENAASHVALGRVHRLRWEWTQVEQCARKALQIDAQNTQALDLLAESLSFRNRTKEAIAYRTSLLRLKPEDSKSQAQLQNAFQNPFFAVLTALMLPVWFCLYKIAPIVLPSVTNNFLLGMCAFALTPWFIMAVNALVFRFCPLAFLMPQPTFRQQPLHIREHVIRACRREWLSNKWVIYTSLLLLLSVVFVALVPYTLIKRICALLPRLRPETEARNTSAPVQE